MNKYKLLILCLFLTTFSMPGLIFSQNIGISTSYFSPQSPLHIHRTNNGNYLQLSKSENWGTGLVFYYSSTLGRWTIRNREQGDITFHTNNSSFHFLTNNLERMTILTSGSNIFTGIGTTTPENTLEVTGNNIYLNYDDWNAPEIESSLNLPDNANCVKVMGAYAYVGINSADNEFRVIDISVISNPTEIASLDMPDNVNDIFISDNYAYVVTNNNGDDFHIIDINNPKSPTEIGSVNIGANANSLYVVARYAYVTHETSSSKHFSVVDIANPTAPSVVSTLDLSGTGHGIFIMGKYAYVSTSAATNQFKAIDISNPLSPSLSGTYNCGSPIYDVYVSGKHAFVVGMDNPRFKILDISDPSSIQLTSSSNLDDVGSAIHVNGRYAYITTASSGNDFNIYDIFNPSSPTLATSLNLPDNANDVYISGKYAFVTTNSSGDDFHIIDISGMILPTADFGTIMSGNMSVNEKLIVKNNTYAQYGLNVGKLGIKSDGPFGSASSLNSYFNGNLGIGVKAPTYQIQLSTDLASKPSTNTWTITSDERLKNIIGPYNKGLNEIIQLKPVIFKYKNTSNYIFNSEVLQTTNIGFIAQDVQKIFPECVSLNENGYLDFDYQPIFVASINALKELKTDFDQLNKSMDEVEKEMTKTLNLINNR